VRLEALKLEAPPRSSFNPSGLTSDFRLLTSDFFNAVVAAAGHAADARALSVRAAPDARRAVRFPAGARAAAGRAADSAAREALVAYSRNRAA